MEWRGPLILFVSLVFAGAAPPSVPEGASDGEVVEIDGLLYEVQGDKLVPLDDALDDAIADAAEAETAPTPFDDRPKKIVVTGSRVDSRVDAAVVRTEIIDDEVIRDRGATNLSDVLQQQAGMQVNSSVGTGEQVTMDGLDGKYVLILVDGRPVVGKTNDRVDISRLPVTPNNIERIEIVRGPMSALYGSEALGGVINIVTKRPEPGVHAYIETGVVIPRGGANQGTYDMGVQAAGGPFTLRLSTTGRGNDAYDRAQKVLVAGVPGETPAPNTIIDIPDGRSDLPYRRQLGFNGEVGVFLTDTWRANVYTQASTNEVTTKLVQGIPFRDNTLITDVALGTELSGDIFPGHQLTFDVRVDRYTHLFSKLPDSGEEDPPAFCGSDDDNFGLRLIDPECPANRAVRTRSTYDQSMLEARYVGELARGKPMFDELNLSSGAVLFLEHFERKDGNDVDTIPGGASLYRGAIYGEVLYRPVEWFSVIPGFRFDAFVPAAKNGQGNAFGPKISSRLDLPWGFAMRGSYGQGFRLPSFQERFLRFDHSELGYVVEGNDALNPETSRGFRSEMLWAWDRYLSASVEGYLNLIDDMIQATAKPGDPIDPLTGVPVFTYQNIARAYTAGLNVSLATTNLYGFGGDLGYGYIFNAIDASACPEENPYFCSYEDGAVSLANIPTHSLHVGGRYTLYATGTTLSAHAEYLSVRPISATVIAPPYLLAGFGLRQLIFENAELHVRAENLLDQYDPVSGPKPGLNARVNLRVWF